MKQSKTHFGKIKLLYKPSGPSGWHFSWLSVGWSTESTYTPPWMGCWSIAGLPPALSLPVPIYASLRVKCVVQEHDTMSPARACTQAAQSGGEHSNYEATWPYKTRFNLWLLWNCFWWTRILTSPLKKMKTWQSWSFLSICCEHIMSTLLQMFIHMPPKKGAFLWSDMDQDQWSIGSFDELWSDWSRITDHDPKGMHPKWLPLILVAWK